MTLEYSWVLLLLPLPLLFRRWLPPHREVREAVRVPFMDRLVELTGEQPSPGAAVRRPRTSQRVLVLLVWCCAIAALARPQWVGDPITKTIPTRDLLLAVDLSGSMETEDFTDTTGQNVDRLTAIKEVLDDFLKRRKGDRVGLIFFGSAAFVQAPFTEDLDVCRALLDEAQARMAGPKTMLGDAIGLAMTVFERSDVKERVLILLTDGNDTGSRVPPQKAAEIAADRGITIHTVAVGDPEAASEEKLDEETLRAIGSATGGSYSHAGNREELEKTYQSLDALETRKAETLTHRPKRDLFHWPLGLLVALTLTFHAGMLAATGNRRRSVEEATHA